MAYTDWKLAYHWLVTYSKDPEIAPGNILQFEGDGSTRATNKVKNLSSKTVWANDFPYTSGSDSVKYDRPELNPNGMGTTNVNTEITRTAAVPPAKATLKCTRGTGSISWIAQEG